MKMIVRVNEMKRNMGIRIRMWVTGWLPREEGRWPAVAIACCMAAACNREARYSLDLSPTD